MARRRTRRPARRGLRVIAGSARGRRLAVPRGTTTRPMRDRVRESVFSALDVRDLVDGAEVLDLYCGSGALAIEALSRGARRALLVDDDPTAVEVARANLESTGLAPAARVEQRDVPAFVSGAPPAAAPFDLVFVDPPFALADADLAAVLAGVSAPGWLATGATLVVQRHGALPPLPAGWEIAWERTFGDTLMTFARARTGA